MIVLNKLTNELFDEMMRRGDINEWTSPKFMSIQISRRWRRFDACHWSRPPLHLTREFIEGLHRDDPCRSFARQFSEREEHAADIIIDAALAMRALGCKNIEQCVKDRLAWRMRHRD